eukprot:c16926_g1_i1 orf=20-2062(+)
MQQQLKHYHTNPVVFTKLSAATNLLLGKAACLVAHPRHSACKVTTPEAAHNNFTAKQVQPARPSLSIELASNNTDGLSLRLAMVGAVASMIAALPLYSSPADASTELPLNPVVADSFVCSSFSLQQETYTAPSLEAWINPKPSPRRRKMVQFMPQRAKIVSYIRNSSVNVSTSIQPSQQCIFHEQGGDSSRMEYEQLIQEHEDGKQKREMFTGDAWLGMMRLQKYNNLLDNVEQQEKLCAECTHNRRLLEQVWQTVSNEYFDQYGRFSQAEWAGELFQTLDGAGGLLHSKAETYKAAKGMVARLLDRYSSFLTPEEYRFALRRPIQSELKYLAYQYTGVGMQIGKRHSKGGFEIVAPFAGSPAEEAGILGGERLLSVDGFPVNLLTADEAVTLLRGPIGSLVELEVIDANPNAVSRKLVLERRALPLPALKMQMINAEDGRLVAYIRLHYFTHDGTTKMASVIREGEALGVDGYILDLRNNPGGVFEEAIAMAALWLDCKDCGITETVRSNAADVDDFTYVAGNLPETIFLRHPGVLTHAPLVTISNRNSASASEVLQGALQDNGRTYVLGERTFGKGVVQYFFPMDDGSGLKLTVAKYLTPKRYDISKQGGLLPNKLCSDYPHSKGMFDECINQAVTNLQLIADAEEREQLRTGLTIPAPMPYRWLPLREGGVWAKGKY